MSRSMPLAYSSPLYYDIAFQDGIQNEVTILNKIIRKELRGGRKAGPIIALEPACGTGRLMIALRHTGAIDGAIGIDLSEEAIALAEEKLHSRPVYIRDSLDFSVGDICTVRDIRKALTNRTLPRFAYCPINTLRELRPHQFVDHLKAMRKFADPNDFYLIGLHLTPAKYITNPESYDYKGDAEVSVGSRLIDGCDMRVTCTLNTTDFAPNARRLYEECRIHFDITYDNKSFSQTSTLRFTIWTSERMRHAIESSGWKLANQYDFFGKPLASVNKTTEDVMMILRPAK